MDFFDKLGATLSSAGKDVSQKAKDLSGTAKLNLDIKGKEDLIQKQYTELGKVYYAAHKDDPSAEGINFIHAIRAAEQDIARMKDDIMKIKGAVKCPKCGALLPEGTGFCGQCGTKIAAPAASAAESAASYTAAPSPAPAASQTYEAAPSPMPTASQTYASAPAQAAPAQGEVPSAPAQSEPTQVTSDMTEK